MWKNYLLYFKALAWAAIGGAGDGVVEYGKTLLGGHGFKQMDWHQVGQSAAYSAIMAAAAYLKLPHGAAPAPPTTPATGV